MTIAMKNLIYINACMRAGSRTRRIATPIVEELRKRYNDKECYGLCKAEKVIYITTRGMDISTGDPLEQATPYIKALSHLWGWGELTVISAQNMDYSSPEEIEERVSKAIAEGLEICKQF